MKQRINEHQRVQDLRGQVEEIMDFCLRSGYTVDRFRDTIICLLEEHKEGSTDEFRKHKAVSNSQRDDRLNPEHFLGLV